MLLSVAGIDTSAQSAPEGKGQEQETHGRGYWIDPSTGLLWAGTDNAKDVSWNQAMKYCQNLSLARYSDWRLPLIDELQRIYDDSGFTAPRPKDRMPVLAGKARGGLPLTGAREWSSSRVLDDRRHCTGYAWQYDYPHGEGAGKILSGTQAAYTRYVSAILDGIG